MKVSVSLPGDDVEFLDDYATKQGLDSRSAALQRAVRLLRVSELGAVVRERMGGVELLGGRRGVGGDRR